MTIENEDDVQTVRSAYVKQIREAAADIDSADYVIEQLLAEYGAKAYRQGRRDFGADVAKLAQRS